MSFNVEGFVLVLLTFVFVAGQFLAHKWIKKVTNSYFFWLAIGILCFTWLMVYRFADQFSAYYSYGKFTDPSSSTESLIISRGLLLDLCPFCGFFMPILLMVDPSRKAAKVLAPTCLLAGLTTVLSFMGDDQAHLTAQFIFTGDSQNPCYFIMHFLQVVLAVGVILNTPRYGWKGYVWGIGCCLSIYAYVGFARLATGAAWYVSGLSYNDWINGEYRHVAEILHWNPKICPYICLPFMWVLGSLIPALKDYVIDRGWFRYGNAYSGKWYSWYNYNKFVKQKVL